MLPWRGKNSRFYFIASATPFNSSLEKNLSCMRDKLHFDVVSFNWQHTAYTFFFRSKTNTKLADEFLMKCPCLHRSALISSDVCWDEKLFYCFTSSLKNFSSQNKFSTFSLSPWQWMNEWMMIKLSLIILNDKMQFYAKWEQRKISLAKEEKSLNDVKIK